MNRRAEQEATTLERVHDGDGERPPAKAHPEGMRAGHRGVDLAWRDPETLRIHLARGLPVELPERPPILAHSRHRKPTIGEVVVGDVEGVKGSLVFDQRESCRVFEDAAMVDKTHILEGFIGDRSADETKLRRDMREEGAMRPRYILETPTS